MLQLRVQVIGVERKMTEVEFDWVGRRLFKLEGRKVFGEPREEEGNGARDSEGLRVQAPHHFIRNTTRSQSVRALLALDQANTSLRTLRARRSSTFREHSILRNHLANTNPICSDQAQPLAFSTKHAFSLQPTQDRRARQISLSQGHREAHKGGSRSTQGGRAEEEGHQRWPSLTSTNTRSVDLYVSRSPAKLFEVF
jgi:hypothetical protein